MSPEEIKAEVAGMPVGKRKEPAAFLDIFRQAMSRKIDDTDPANWLTLEELDLRLQAPPA